MLSFPELLSELRRLCAERSTGFVLIRPSSGKLARLTLEQGEIVHISYQQKSGVDTLPLLSTIDSGQLDFLEGLGGTSKTLLPSTDEILTRLAGAASPVTHVATASDAASGVSDAASRQVSARALSPRSQSILEATLADYIGPMAAIVCSGDQVRNKSLEKAIEVLAKEIPDPESGRKFMADVRAKLA